MTNEQIAKKAALKIADYPGVTIDNYREVIGRNERGEEQIAAIDADAAIILSAINEAQEENEKQARTIAPKSIDGWPPSLWPRTTIQRSARVYARGGFTQVLVDMAQEVCRLKAELDAQAQDDKGLAEFIVTEMQHCGGRYMDRADVVSECAAAIAAYRKSKEGKDANP